MSLSTWITCWAVPGSPSADKGDMAGLSHQPHSGPKRKTWGMATASCPHDHISRPQQSRWAPVPHSRGTEVQNGKVARAQAHRGRGSPREPWEGRVSGIERSTMCDSLTTGPQISEPQFPPL